MMLPKIRRATPLLPSESSSIGTLAVAAKTITIAAEERKKKERRMRERKIEKLCKDKICTYNVDQHHQDLHLLPRPTTEAPEGKQPHNELTSDYNNN
ncbi:uncharacterized protein DS421_17g575930 [Arachis hypogaea]|nr:uncharacterized protein DS421_17g575930 [Arachis hypogaea]